MTYVRLMLLLMMSVILGAIPATADVLGPCGTPDADTPQAAAPTAAAHAGLMPLPVASSVPLPGDQAPNFELDAVVGDEIRKVKLSDYDGKWRVVCFYPADFTFV